MSIQFGGGGTQQRKVAMPAPSAAETQAGAAQGQALQGIQTNQAALDVVLEAFDRFCVVGHECSVSYVAEKLAELGKPYQRTMSYQPEALAGVIDEVDCVVICGAQGRYASDKPAVALMGADRTVQNWTPPARRGAKGPLIFVEPVTQAPASRTDWYYPFALERGGDLGTFKEMRVGLRASRLAKRAKQLA